MKKILTAFCLLLLAAGIVSAQGGIKKKRPLPHEYGRVVMNNYTGPGRMAPVVFEHWLHRTKFTCRLCHVDLAFAMKANTTRVKAADNMRGFYCGACHNGKMAHESRTVFEACSKKASDDPRRCDRCHSEGKRVKAEYDFYAHTTRFPKERFGNGIDWEKAEADGMFRLVDYLEGISTKREALPIQNDFVLMPKVQGMPDIIFSHKKHTVWNSCEVCHPDIFFGVRKGSTKYSMVEIFEGKYCGVCHTSVAFPLTDCQRCHSKPVQ